ncbi:MAG TPA: hypothetical protein VFA04_23680 [Bryobacteraceae bacterium]|jgi:hypothetical protein|nr:hypothetical protein [Bryobacteraceae bacterium]
MRLRCLVLSLALCAPAAIVWGQDMATTNAPIARTVAWHGPQGDILLRPSLLYTQADAHYSLFTLVREDRLQPVTREGRIAIGDAMPSIAVQGFGPGSDWVLAKFEERDGIEVLRVPSRNPWGDEFFSDVPFSHRDIIALTQSGAGESYTLRPAAPLSPGGYILCAKPAVDQGGWMRVCYDFQVGGGGAGS